MKLALINIIFDGKDRSDDCERWEGYLLEPGMIEHYGSTYNLKLIKQKIDTYGQQITQITRYFERTR